MTGRGQSRNSAHLRDGSNLRSAENTCRNRDYPDIYRSDLVALVVLGCETYGRWSHDFLRLVRELRAVKLKAKTVSLKTRFNKYIGIAGFLY